MSGLSEAGRSYSAFVALRNWLLGVVVLLLLLAAFLQGCTTKPPTISTTQQECVEPITTDCKDSRFAAYLDRVRKSIKENWAYPCVKDRATGRCEYKTDVEVVLVFRLLKDGRVPHIDIQKSSGYDIYDDYAVNAVKLGSNHFAPPPAELMKLAKSESVGVRILARFSYKIVK